MDVIDAATFKVVHNWPNSPGSGASGLAIDKQNMFLFATCENKMMIVMDANTGKILATEPTGQGADGAGFDNRLKAAYSSNGEGTLTVVQELPGNRFNAANVATGQGARTIAVDPTTHKVYLPSASFKPASKESFRPQIIPGTFKILVVEKS
jgi:DNA-binding beta-propeller fold protein YncE